jgi:hypothetical protein
LDLVSETLDTCRKRIDEGIPAVEQLAGAVIDQRTKLASGLAEGMRTELLTSRRQWENRLLGKVASRWGFSPFALTLRIYQALGGLLSSALLMRARSPAQLALWGALEAGRTWQRHRSKQRADRSADRAVAQCWDQTELRESSLVLHGYVAQAGLNRQTLDPKTIAAEAAAAGRLFVSGVAAELESLLGRVAERHTGWFTRWRYELLLIAMLGLLLFRPAKNFFYDTWLAAPQTELYGLSFYVLSAFWLLLWCCLLIWSFTGRLRRGLRREISALAQGWNNPKPAEAVFSRLESECSRVSGYRDELERLKQHVSALRRRLALPDEQLGHRR